MARGKSKVAAFGRTDTPYENSDQIPWAQLEEEIGNSFSRTDRTEIYLCGFCGVAHGNVARDGVLAKDVQQLREILISHTEGLINMYSSARSESGELRNENAEALLHALDSSIGRSDFDLIAKLKQLVPLAEEILLAVQSSSIDAEATAINHEVVELAHFIAECLDGAEAIRARANPGYLEIPTVFEYRRWGLLLSPKNGPLPKLASVVLRREVTSTQIRHAFKVAKDLNLLQQ